MRDISIPSDNPHGNRIVAWGIHLFTASGVIWSLLAIIAIIGHQWQLAFAWMMLAACIDFLDGSLARYFRIGSILPEFDGALLDNIVDYLSYVFVPALFLWGSDLLPSEWKLPSAIMISLASAYQFCQSDAKTTDHSFKGFPSYWNFAIFYLFFLKWNPWINFAILFFLSLFVFVPIKYAYPSLMKRYKLPTVILTLTWFVMLVAILIQYPNQQYWLILTSLLYIVYYVAISLYLKPSRN